MNDQSEQVERFEPEDWDEMHPGRFIKSGQFHGQKLTFEIAAVYRELMRDQSGKDEWVNVVQFVPRKPGKPGVEFRCNRTNSTCIREMFGRKPQEWTGHKITLFPAPFQSQFGDTAIRVWGSPELDEDREIMIELPRRRPIKWTLHAVKAAV